MPQVPLSPQAQVPTPRGGTETSVPARAMRSLACGASCMVTGCGPFCSGVEVCFGVEVGEVMLHRLTPLLRVGQLRRMVRAPDDGELPVGHLGRQVRGLIDQGVIVGTRDDGRGLADGGKLRPEGIDVS